VSVIPLAAGRHYRPLDEAEIYPALKRHHIEFPYILYVGSIEPRKNLPRLLVAYAHLRRRGSTRWRLVVAGPRKWKSGPVYDAVARLELAEHVHFAGFVPEADLPALYNGADLFAFPSLYEGFGLPVLEAMACGTPVVTANTSSLPEVAGAAALLVDPSDVEEIAGALRRVLEDPALARDLRERGLARAAQFSWERTARATVAVYEKVLGNRIL
jgi:glycosyltransferase involved in cell wall biosynthesis